MPDVDRSIHPGEILRHEFMEPLGLSFYKTAEALKVDHLKFGQFLYCQTDLDERLAERIGRYFGTSTQVWLNLQASYDRKVLATIIPHPRDDQGNLIARP